MYIEEADDDDDDDDDMGLEKYLLRTLSKCFWAADSEVLN